MKVTIGSLIFEGTPEEIREFLHGNKKKIVESNIEKIQCKSIENIYEEFNANGFTGKEVTHKSFEFDVVFKDGGFMSCSMEVPFDYFVEKLKVCESIEDFIKRKIESGLE